MVYFGIGVSADKQKYRISGNEIPGNIHKKL